MLLHVNIQFSQHHSLKRLSFLHWIFLAPLSLQILVDWIYLGLFLGSLESQYFFLCLFIYFERERENTLSWTVRSWPEPKSRVRRSTSWAARAPNVILLSLYPWRCLLEYSLWRNGVYEETLTLRANIPWLCQEKAELAVLPMEHDFYLKELPIPLGCSNLIIWQKFSQKSNEVSSSLQGEKLTVICY